MDAESRHHTCDSGSRNKRERLDKRSFPRGPTRWLLSVSLTTETTQMITVGSSSTTRASGTKERGVGVIKMSNIRGTAPMLLELRSLRRGYHPSATGAQRRGPRELGLNPLRRRCNLAAASTSESSWWSWFGECGSWNQLLLPGDHCWGDTGQDSKPTGRMGSLCPSFCLPVFLQCPCWQSLTGRGEMCVV